MPYSQRHKAATRKRIVETARVLFNRHGFKNVSIDCIMKEVGLTRGGFYNHFQNKEALYSEAVASFLTGRGARWRSEAGINETSPTREDARLMMLSYLSDEHLGDTDAQCPMIALPSDTAREGTKTHAAFEQLLTAMVGLFEKSLSPHIEPDMKTRPTALSMAALCVGGMVLAKSIPDSMLAKEVRDAALNSAETLMGL